MLVDARLGVAELVMCWPLVSMERGGFLGLLRLKTSSASLRWRIWGRESEIDGNVD